jgi:hypothetical protein
VQADRDTTSSARLSKDRELVKAAALATIVFGVLLTVLMLVAAWLAARAENAELDRQIIIVRGLLLIAGIVLIGLGLGVWYRQQWCAVATIILLIVLMAALIYMSGRAVGSVFFLLIPLIPIIANWLVLPALRRLAQAEAQTGDS